MGPTDSVTSSLIGAITVFLSQVWSALISEKVSEYFIRVIWRCSYFRYSSIWQFARWSSILAVVSFISLSFSVFRSAGIWAISVNFSLKLFTENAKPARPRNNWFEFRQRGSKSISSSNRLAIACFCNWESYYPSAGNPIPSIKRLSVESLQSYKSLIIWFALGALIVEPFSVE